MDNLLLLKILCHDKTFIAFIWEFKVLNSDQYFSTLVAGFLHI